MERRFRRALALALLLASSGVVAGTSFGAPAPATTINASSTATFGKTTAGPSMKALTADQKRASQFSVAEYGSVASISAYLDGKGSAQGTSQSVRFLLYADDAGNPGTLLAATGSHAIAKKAAAAWVTLALPTPLAIAPGRYHLGIHTGATGGIGRYASASSAGALKQNTNSFAGGASNPFGSAMSADQVLSIYATYSPEPAPAPAPPPIPSATALPTISGTAVEGATLTATEGTWINAPTSYAYSWQRCDAAGGACSTIDGASASSRALTSADVGSTIRVLVTAANAAGSASAASAPTATVASAPDTQAPSTPQAVTATGATQNAITLGWSASTDNVGVAGYRVYRNGSFVASTQLLSQTITGLSCGTTYSLAVEAYDAASNTSARGSIDAATTACPDTQAPSTPQGLTATSATQTAITLGWSASTDNVGVAGYRVYRDGALVASTQQLSQTITGLSCGTTYSLAVEAYDAASNTSTRGGVNAATSACPPDTQPPSVPQGMAWAGKTQTSLSLVWNASTDNVGVAGYHLYRNGVRIASIQALTYTVTSLACGTSYTIGLEAYDAAGNVSNRGEATGTTTTSPCDPPPADTQPPATPQGLAFSARTQTSVSLSWNASTDNVGVTGYHVYRDGVRVASVQTLSYGFAGLACGVTYTFGVEAYDAAGNISTRGAATTATDACTSTPPPAAGTAHLWVDRDGGTCTRSATPAAYVDAAACATFDNAYDAANLNSGDSTILIRGGTYPAQTLTGNRAATGTITFDRAPGETALVKGVVTIAGSDRITFKNLETAEFGSPWENPNNKFAVRTQVGTTFARFENMTVGGFLIEGSQDIDIIGGSVGPCRAQSYLDAFGSDGTTGPLGNGIQPCYGGLKIDHNGAAPNRITVDGVDFHDFDYSDECVRQGKPGYVFPPGLTPDTCHWRVMYNNGVQNFTLRNSTFRNSVFQPWFTVSGPDAGATGNQNILIENNQFGAQLFYQTPSWGVGGALTLAHCRTANAYRNVTIRFNSFSNMGSIDLGLTEAGCGFQNINIYGNIVSKGVYSCVAGVNYGYNVYTRSSGTCGGTGEVHAGGTAFPFYASDSPSPFGPVFALTGAIAAPDNRVPSSWGCPAADARGTPRPQTPGFCDAGAFER